jgi:hypothetical protein
LRLWVSVADMMEIAVRISGGFAGNTVRPSRYTPPMRRLPCFLILAAQSPNNLAIYRPGFDLGYQSSSNCTSYIHTDGSKDSGVTISVRNIINVAHNIQLCNVSCNLYTHTFWNFHFSLKLPDRIIKMSPNCCNAC